MTNYPYVLLRESSKVTLIDVLNGLSYPILTGVTYSYKYDWMDGTYYDWAWRYMLVEGGYDDTAGEEFFDVVITTSSDNDSHIEKYRFGDDFIRTLKHM